MRSDDLLQRVSVLIGRRNETRSAVQKAHARLEELTAHRARLEQAQIVIQTVAQITQDQLEYRISELTSCALESIFPRPYRLHAKFECKRGRTECPLMFLLPSGEEIAPMDATGFGPVDVAAFALRLTLMTLQKPRRRPVVVLDEPFKYVSKDLLPHVADLLHSLSDKLQIQFIIVTHEDRLIAEGDTVFRVRLKDDVSVVTCDTPVEIGAETAAKAEEEYEW